MKVRIELLEGASQEEVIIRCAAVDDRIRRIQQYILGQGSGDCGIVFYKENREYYFPLDEVLFFETDGEHVYAHTLRDAFRVRRRLYELEEILPASFARVSKSAVVNLNRIYSIDKNLAAASLIHFAGSHKQIYLSRHYYREVRRRLDERRGGADFSERI